MWRPVIQVVMPLVAVSILVAACSGNGEESERPDLAVVAATGVIADWVEVVGGDAVSVQALVPAGADAHTFQLTPGDIRAVAAADLVVLNGGGLEAGFADAVRDAATGVIIELTDFVDLEPFPAGLAHDHGREDEGHDEDAHEEEGDHDEEAHEEDEDHDDDAHEDEHSEDEAPDDADHGDDSLDPHFWLDPVLAIAAVEALRDALIDLAAGTEVGERADAYADALRALDAQLAQDLAALSEERRVLVTFHDAYGYFARRYDLEILGFVVEGPEDEPSAAAVAELIEEMREHGVARIYREPQFSAQLVEQIAGEAGAAVGTIYSQVGSDVPTYIELLRANAEAMTE